MKCNSVGMQNWISTTNCSGSGATPLVECTTRASAHTLFVHRGEGLQEGSNQIGADPFQGELLDVEETGEFRKGRSGARLGGKRSRAQTTHVVGGATFGTGKAACRLRWRAGMLPVWPRISSVTSRGILESQGTEDTASCWEVRGIDVTLLAANQLRLLVSWERGRALAMP